MSMTIETHVNHHLQNSFIEWDTVRGRGNFDAGYVNEFSLCMNENGEIDEQKRKQFDEDPQYKHIRAHKASSLCHKRSRQNVNIKKSTASDSQITKKVRKPRTVKASQANLIKTQQVEPEINIMENNNLE